MDNRTLSLMMGAAGGASKLDVEDVFSTWLYAGNGSTQTITNGIDLSGKGGLVWIKGRSDLSPSTGHNVLVDTSRGIYNILFTNTTGAEINQTNTVTAFNSSGFNLGNYQPCNQSGSNFTSWTFRKAAKFFDVVTWVGDGVAGRTISHSLGSAPGCIIVKNTSGVGNWQAWHRSVTANSGLFLNTTDAAFSASQFAALNQSTSTSIYVNNDSQLNSNGQTYVAYLFAHDAGGFGDSGNDSVVKCGSFAADGSGNATIDLGWEPQWILIKRTSTSGTWAIYDNMRGMPTGSNFKALLANAIDAEADGPVFNLTPTGITHTGGGLFGTYIYIAIRRGPMKTPTDATKVFSTFARSGTGAAATITTPAFPVDFILGQERTAIGLNGGIAVDRLRGAAAYLRTPVTTAEGSNTTVVSALDSMTGFSLGASNALNGSSSTYANWVFRRAPGFFDVVAFTGAYASTAYSHSLGVTPEMIILKRRSNLSDWIVYHTGVPSPLTNQPALNLTGGYYANFYFSASPTSTQFSAQYLYADNWVAYLFASCPGVSKVGSYTGTGTTLNVDCGFTNGARFVLIKRTDSAGDWYVWDTARGIISGNDPYLLLNSTAAEVTNTDFIDPLSSGFQISSTAPAAINANGGSFIFLAIA